MGINGCTMASNSAGLGDPAGIRRVQQTRASERRLDHTTLNSCSPPSGIDNRDAQLRRSLPKVRAHGGQLPTTFGTKVPTPLKVNWPSVAVARFTLM